MKVCVMLLLSKRFKINLRKEKWLVISIYKATSKSSEHVLDSLTNFIKSFSETYNGFINMGNFEMQPRNRCSKSSI